MTMVFPSTPLELTAELLAGGSWTDITADVFNRDGGGISITRGRADEGSRTDPSTAAFSLRNPTGDYSPRNPVGPYYGQIGRNTPVRFSVAGASTYLAMPGDTSSKATTPDAVELGITGDIDIRVDLELDSWRRRCDLAAKYVTAGDQRSWALYLHGSGSGVLGFSWSTAGTLATTVDRLSTVPVPAPATGRQALRVTLDVNNGASGHTVTFYTAETLAGPWTQLGDPVVTAGVTSIFDSTAGIELGDTTNLTAEPVKGKIFGFELRSGIGGSSAANPDFTSQTPGAGSFADAAGRTWTIAGDAEITARDTRFVGEISSWPQRWDVTGLDVWVPCEASGIQRRLGAGAPVEGSVMRRGVLFDALGVVAYWPMEDAEGSTSLAAATPGTAPMAIVGEPELGGFTDFTASGGLPILGGAQFSGAAPIYTPGTATQVRFILAVPAAGDADNQAILTFYTTGSLTRWEVHYGTGGTLGLRAFASGATSPVFDTGDVAFAINGQTVMVSIELTQNGADVDYLIGRLEIGDSVGDFFGGTAAGQTVGRVGTLVVSPNGGIADTAIGHLTVGTQITTFFELKDQMVSWVGETAGRRIVRLCAEEGIEIIARGDIDATAQMGAQPPGTLLDLLAEAAETDGGVLYEPRQLLGLAYRTRESLYNQDPRLQLDYEAGHLVPPLEPTDDDQGLRNDITVTRRDGSSARAELVAGPLSVQPPPDGVGRYDEQIDINPRYDAALYDQAWWRLHLATVDETRWPVISLNLAKLYADGSTTTAEAAAALDVGDRLTIDNPPAAWLPPSTIDQLALGFSEFLGHFDWDIGVNAVPASPYAVAELDVAGRYGPVSTVTAEALDTTETGVDVDTPTGPLWSTAATGYQIVIGGEVMTVTAVSAAVGTAQTLTVTRSVNGVVKPHASGAVVELAAPAIYAL